MRYPDTLIETILADTRTIAVVGASNNPARPSYGVMQWLIRQGYEVHPVNPGLTGTLLGQAVTPSLADLPGPVDMVDVFRNSEAVGAVVDEVLAMPHRPKFLWLQLGVVHAAAAARAEAAGLTVIMDRCPVIEAGRLRLPPKVS